MTDRQAQQWSDEIALRVWCVRSADWLRRLGAWLGRDPATFLPSAPARFIEVPAPGKGLSLQLHYPFWDRTAEADPERWLISQADFEAGRAPLPFGLDPAGETLASARAKLSDDMEVFPQARGASYFLDDHRVVMLTFGDGDVGLSRVRMTRLYGAVSLRT